MYANIVYLLFIYCDSIVVAFFSSVIGFQRDFSRKNLSVIRGMFSVEEGFD